MKTYKLKITTTVVSIFTLLASMIGLVSVGFSCWVISKNDSTNIQGDVDAEGIVFFEGISITSVTSFTYSHYSFGNDSTFRNTGTISYSLSVTPSALDGATKTALKSTEGLKLYSRFNSLLEVFDNNFALFNGVSSIGNPALVNFSNCDVSNDYKNIYFDFRIPQMTNEQLYESEPNASFTYNLTFTFNSKLLIKNYGVDEDNNHLTIMDNKFTLYLAKESFN